MTSQLTTLATRIREMVAWGPSGADTLLAIADELDTLAAGCSCGEQDGMAVYSSTCVNEYHRQRAATHAAPAGARETLEKLAATVLDLHLGAKRVEDNEARNSHFMWLWRGKTIAYETVLGAIDQLQRAALPVPALAPTSIPGFCCGRHGKPDQCADCGLIISKDTQSSSDPRPPQTPVEGPQDDEVARLKERIKELYRRDNGWMRYVVRRSKEHKAEVAALRREVERLQESVRITDQGYRAVLVQAELRADTAEREVERLTTEKNERSSKSVPFR